MRMILARAGRGRRTVGAARERSTRAHACTRACKRRLRREEGKGEKRKSGVPRRKERRSERDVDKWRVGYVRPFERALVAGSIRSPYGKRLRASKLAAGGIES